MRPAGRGYRYDRQPPARLCRTAGAHRTAHLTGPVVVVALDPAATPPHRLSADTAVVRHRASGGNASPHAVVAYIDAALARLSDYRRRRRPALASAAGGDQNQFAARRSHRR